MPPGVSPPFVPHFKFPLPAHYLPLYFGALVATLLGMFFALWWRSRRRRAGRSTSPADGCLSLLMVGLLLVVAEGCFYRFVNLSDSFANSNMGRLWFWRNVRENNWGHRDNIDYTLRPAGGKKRIVFLGDSFAYGHGVSDVDDRLSNRIRARLESVAPERFEVYTLSFPGWSTQREKEFLSKLPGAGFRADLVVLVYVLNDPIYLEGLRHQDKQNRDRMDSFQPKSLLFTKSYLANFLYYRFAVMRRPEAKNYYDWTRQGFQSPYWERHQKDLLMLPVYSKQLGARFAVVTFPFLHSLGDEYGFAEAHRKLGELWKDENVPYLDLLETFTPYEPNALMVNPFDAHPNAAAHRLAAETIYREILVPQFELPLEPSSSCLPAADVARGE